ncbi:MAG: hypothetical protein JKX97_08050 [Candidatus Lindowbacteria bacterium]|nr:hypothetical protein [Candidatus Lindowbacteria bacterium]
MNETKCSRAAFVEQALWDDQLGNRKKNELLDHGKSCPECRILIEEILSAKSALSATSQLRASSSRQSEMWTAINKELDRQSYLKVVGNFIRHEAIPWIGGPFVMAVCLGVFLAFGQPNPYGPYTYGMVEGTSASDFRPHVNTNSDSNTVNSAYQQSLR